LSSSLTASTAKFAADVSQSLVNQGSPLSTAQISITVEPFYGVSTIKTEDPGPSLPFLPTVVSAVFGVLIVALIIYFSIKRLKSAAVGSFDSNSDLHNHDPLPSKNNWITKRNIDEDKDVANQVTAFEEKEGVISDFSDCKKKRGWNELEMSSSVSHSQINSLTPSRRVTQHSYNDDDTLPGTIEKHITYDSMSPHTALEIDAHTQIVKDDNISSKFKQRLSDGTLVSGSLKESLHSNAGSYVDGLASAASHTPIVGNILKGLNLLSRQVESFSEDHADTVKVMGRLTRLQSVVKKAATDIKLCKEHSVIFDYLVKTLNKATERLEMISKRRELGKGVSAQTDIGIFERIDRAIMLHLAEIQAAMQAERISMAKTLQDGFLKRTNREDEIKEPSLPPFSMHFKMTDFDFDPPLESQLLNAHHGRTGVVVFGTWRTQNLPCAIKLIPCRSAGSVSLSMMSWLSEVDLMRRLREHVNSSTKKTPQNVCTLFGVGAVESKITGEASEYMIVMERLEGSLRLALDTQIQKKRHPPLKMALSWIRDVAKGISECHDANIIHSDIRSANVLLSKSKVAKVCDLGDGRVTRNMTASSSVKFTNGRIVLGNLPWLASELIEDQTLQPSKASDVYAWACVCWEVLSCRVPYHNEKGEPVRDLSKMSTLAAIATGEIRPDPSVVRADAPPSIVEIMKRAWDPEPRDRPQISDILNVFDAAMSSFDDVKKNVGVLKKAVFASSKGAGLKSMILLAQADKSAKDDEKFDDIDLKALHQSLEEERVKRILMVKKRRDEAYIQMRAEIEAEEKRLEEEARREMALATKVEDARSDLSFRIKSKLSTRKEANEKAAESMRRQLNENAEKELESLREMDIRELILE